MRRTEFFGSAGTVAVFFFVGVAAGDEKIPPQPVSGKIKWVYDYVEGKEAARQSRKPMFVVFRCER